MQRTRTLTLRLSDDEMARLTADAAELDRSISWVARRRIFGEMPAISTKGTPEEHARAREMATQMDPPDASSPTKRKTAQKLTVTSSTTAASFDPAAGTFTNPANAGYTASATSTMNARDLNLRKGLVDRHGEDSELVRQFDESHR